MQTGSTSCEQFAGVAQSPDLVHNLTRTRSGSAGCDGAGWDGLGMTSHRPEFSLNRPAALIAAIPAVLGFVPEKSLVLVAVDRGEMGAVMRVDLPKVLQYGAEELVDVVDAARSDAVIAVIVDAEGADCPSCNDDYQGLCDELSDILGEYGMELIAGHVVDRIAAGGRWHCVDRCGAGGRIDNPESSPLTMAAVLDGRRLYATRAELESVIAADESHEGSGIAQAVAELAAGGAADRERDPDGSSRRAVGDAITAAGRIADGQVLTEAEIASIAYGLTDLTVRDTLYGLAVGESADAAEALWATLSRRLPEPWRAEALTLLAFFAYARGDGPLAGVALERALRIDPTHRMAGMLDTALQSGMRPRQIRQLALTGYRLAQRIGVELPPRQRYDRAG